MTQSNVNLSQDSDDTQANLAQELGETQFSTQNIEQALDILSFEAENLNDVQQQETAIANVNLLRNLMRQTGVTSVVADPDRPAGAMRAMTMKTTKGVSNGTLADQGIDVTSRVQDLGFVEFTAGLINGTFDAIIGATLKQMEAYTKLVGDLAKTLEQFKATNVSDAQINAHLSNRYPDGAGGTSISTGYEFKETIDSTTGVKTSPDEQITAITNALIAETSGIGAGKLTGILLATTVTDNQVKVIHTAIGSMLAVDMMSQLKAMARDGMARIVITDGSVKSKLMFKISTTDTYITQAKRYSADSLNASVNGYYGGKNWGVSGSVAYSQVNVSTFDATNYDNMTMSAEIMGEVNLRFKTETFASFEPPM
jgi:hypothetical protein